jgi:hypothetical protein
MDTAGSIAQVLNSWLRKVKREEGKSTETEKRCREARSGIWYEK